MNRIRHLLSLIALILACSCAGVQTRKEFSVTKTIEISTPPRCEEMIDNTPTFCAWFSLGRDDKHAISVQAYASETSPEGEPIQTALEVFFIVEKQTPSPDGKNFIFIERSRNFDAEWKSSSTIRLGDGGENEHALFAGTDGNYRIRYSTGDIPASRFVITVESHYEEISITQEDPASVVNESEKQTE